MKAILIDDENPALRYLEQLLAADGRLQVTGKYTSARGGLDHLARERADIVFLDIGMPQMNGLEAAEHIQQLDGSIRIVYITAFSEYAIEAFELHALDYLLKPITPGRLAKTLERIMKLAPSQKGGGGPHEAAASTAATVYCFRRLEWPSNKPIKWRTEKVQELFAYMLYHRGKRLGRDAILEAIWAEQSYEKAINALHMSIYQIRKLLKQMGSAATIEYSLGSYLLTESGLSTDVAELEALDAAGRIDSDERCMAADRVLALYRGHYLEEHDYAWAIPIRKNLQQQHQRLSLSVAEYEIGCGRIDGALERLRRLQDLDPYAGEICRLAMEAYARKRDYDGLRSTYGSFVQLMRSELGVEPDAETSGCYDRLVRERGR